MAKNRKRSEFHTLKIVLVRHGQASGEARKGEIGAPLKALGEKQAARVAKWQASDSCISTPAICRGRFTQRRQFARFTSADPL